MLSSRIRSAPALSASATSASVSASTSTGVPLRSPIAATAAADPAGEAQVVLLDEDRVVEAGAVVRSRRRSAPRTSRARAARASSCGCRGSSRRCPRRARRSGGQRRDAAQPPEQVERRPLAGEHRAGGALDLATRAGTSPASSRAPSASVGSTAVAGSSAVKTAPAAASPHTTPGSSITSCGPAAGLGAHDRLGRQVAGADVLRERRAHDPVDGLGGQLHRSTTGSPSRRTTTCPANASSSVGKSERKCAPRLSRRARALCRDEPRQEGGRLEQPLEPLGAADQARVVPEGPPQVLGHGRLWRAARAVRATRPGAGSASAASAARRPKTRHSSSEFEASRFAPCTPVQAHSPAA